MIIYAIIVQYSRVRTYTIPFTGKSDLNGSAKTSCFSKLLLSIKSLKCVCFKNSIVILCSCSMQHSMASQY